MTIKKSDGLFKVDVRPSGKNGKRYRKSFTTRAEAIKYEKYISAQHHNKSWLDAPVDKRNLSELINKWFFYHGQNLKEGEHTQKKLLKMCKDMGDPQAFQITKKFYLDYRQVRLLKIKPKTANLDYERLRNVFSVLIDAGDYAGENPISALSKVKEPARELSFLTTEQINALLAELCGDMSIIVKICLSTGARWGEAQKLTRSQVLKDRLTFVDTKNGKNRTIPIGLDLRTEILNVQSDDGPRLFSDCYVEFREIMKRMNFGLPKGQSSHVLRHSFASHFVMNGGNILTLQKILGHSTILMTMKYAHLAPDHLFEATKFNPLACKLWSTF
ncbi:tyrosine-type recombinase/integrase [Shewanella sp. D64]|uniref:phage integrase n=1 Tax=unclassified Shewanella TaxID=196818 RepID=UPI0022BA4DF8|nr:MULTISPECIES: tyrosine-type recombinase/integrase [unclassified Shewanella]MEC4727244.1 tyrosine-type recombinase/integrase [Shewanella sp. D64]MEC4739399.1 tyrosine-type recombinase/integrase [Shewanella sp. E94]WBJ96728.1 tyrosine-type recombinase/integrase [Shewanella sp. MTB7]